VALVGEALPQGGLADQRKLFAAATVALDAVAFKAGSPAIRF